MNCYDDVINIVMALTRLEILGYRGFAQKGILDFAVPNGALGSGLTIITGPNNSGKSSILECLRAREGRDAPSFTMGARNSAIEHVEITYVINDVKETIQSISKGSSETIRNKINKNFEFLVMPSRRAFNPYFNNKMEMARDNYILNSPLPAKRSSELHNFEFRLFKIVKNPTEFNELLAQVLGYKPQWTIDRSDHGEYFLKFFNGNKPHSSDGLGEGIVSIFSLVDALYDSKVGDVVAIDEPELSLHPALQKRLCLVLERFASDRQIIISTHSPYFVDISAINNGGCLARVITTEEGTQIYQLTSKSKNSISKLSGGNINNPHILGLDARELFFQEDQIILTEGQEDVILYPKVAKELQLSLPGNLFGWGVGGAGNIGHICQILKDLGFKKVAGLLDQDKMKEASSFKNEFPDFFFACIPTKDIRDKAPRSATEEVYGLLDKKLKVKAEYKDSMSKIFGSVASYMSS